MSSKDANIRSTIVSKETRGPEIELGTVSSDIPADFREADFLTRNGLNLRSFSRRKCLSKATVHHLRAF